MARKETIRVRFAPSPTGFLHLGGIRTALFNWLFARHNRGKFILRIEDTDKARSKKIYLDQILGDLRWLGLEWDEGPYFQSQRLRLYQEQAQRLLQQGLAYADGGAIILKAAGRSYAFRDLIRGEIRFSADCCREEVLIKSDGRPTYNFACCVDDHEMGITHVIRGEDHIPNTPRQLAIYAALQFPAPQFAHIPLIVTRERARLSKRKGAKPVSFYREQGYLPEALVNFLALLGWSPGDNREILSSEELIGEFTLERVVKAAAYFHPEKLEWMNGQYIQSLDTPELARRVVGFLAQKGYNHQDYPWPEFVKMVELFKPRIKRLAEFPEAADFFFQEKIKFTREATEFLRAKNEVMELFKELIAGLDGLDSFDAQSIERTLRQLINREAISAGELIHPLRVALTGRRAGPGLFELMAVLGKERVKRRLKRAMQMVD